MIQLIKLIQVIYLCMLVCGHSPRSRAPRATSTRFSRVIHWRRLVRIFSSSTVNIIVIMSFVKVVRVRVRVVQVLGALLRGQQPHGSGGLGYLFLAAPLVISHGGD